MLATQAQSNAMCMQREPQQQLEQNETAEQLSRAVAAKPSCLFLLPPTQHGATPCLRFSCFNLHALLFGLRDLFWPI